MKYLRNLLFIALIIGAQDFCYAQIKPIGFTQKIVKPEGISFYYYPNLKIIDDKLFVCSNTGIFQKDMIQNTDWELYGFNNRSVIEFIKNGNNLLAVSSGSNLTRNLLLYSEDNGKTIRDYTSSYFLEWGSNYLYRIAQNPYNPNSVLILSASTGIAQSFDFGKNWKRLNDESIGVFHNFISFHPLDTTTIFYCGETDFMSGKIFKSSDNGNTWSHYYIPGGDNAVHHIAFHPTDPDFLLFGGEGVIGKSIDKGETWDIKDLYETGMYFYRVVFDENNPDIIYASGSYSDRKNEIIYVYRSTDKGETWHLAYKEDLGSNCGTMFEMIKYKDKLIFYTLECGLFELDVQATPSLSIEGVMSVSDLSVFPNPVNDILKFETDLIINSIEIVNISGQVIHKAVIGNNERSVDISGLSSGVYFTVFYSDQQKITRKIYIEK